MHHGTAEPPRTLIDDYMGMRVCGWVAAAAGSLGLSVLLSVGISTRLFLPTGFAALTMGLGVVGAILLVGRLVLMKLDVHQADHEQATLTVEDVERITARLDSLDRRVGETHELLAHTSVCQAAAPVQDPASAERRAYAAGAVDMLDGRTAVVPINGAALRIVPVQEPRRTL